MSMIHARKVREVANDANSAKVENLVKDVESAIIERAKQGYYNLVYSADYSDLVLLKSYLTINGYDCIIYDEDECEISISWWEDETN